MKTATKSRIKSGALIALWLFTAATLLPDRWNLLAIALSIPAALFGVAAIGVLIEERWKSHAAGPAS